MLAAIEDAKNNMGDFNLKTAKNYKVPESQRQGGTYKRAQLLELRRMVSRHSLIRDYVVIHLVGRCKSSFILCHLFFFGELEKHNEQKTISSSFVPNLNHFRSI